MNIQKSVNNTFFYFTKKGIPNRIPFLFEKIIQSLFPVKL